VFKQVWFKGSSDISPFAFEKASGTKAGIEIAFDASAYPIDMQSL